MSKSLPEFSPIPTLPGLFSARKGNLRCTAVVLKDGTVCLFSPVQGLGDDTLESLWNIGSVSFLLAPNHYHNKALAEYHAQFQNAALCAPVGASPRLQSVTGLSFEPLDQLNKLLPDNMEFLEPAGLKTGEIWLSVKQGADNAWFVVDAFCGPSGPDKNATKNNPELLKTFPRYGVGNAQQYATWAQARIAEDSPKFLIPCHGAMVQNTNLGIQLNTLVEEAFLTPA